MALTTPPSAPVAASPSVLSAAVNTFHGWCDTIPSQVNTLTYSAISATSTDSETISVASKSIVIAVDTPFAVGMIVMVWNSKTAWMMGRVTSYTSGTRTLVVSIFLTHGSGTLSSWTITVHGVTRPAYSKAVEHRVRVYGGTATGSTNTMIRLFTTTEINIGTAITYATSATNGGSFTINDAGWYGVDYNDANTLAASAGISLNSTELTTSIASLTNVADRLSISTIFTTTGSGSFGSTQLLRYFNAGDVLRAHVTRNSNFVSGANSYFDIFKIP